MPALWSTKVRQHRFSYQRRGGAGGAGGDHEAAWILQHPRRDEINEMPAKPRTSYDFPEGGGSMGQRVAVIGFGVVGRETASLLAARGDEVRIVQRHRPQGIPSGSAFQGADAKMAKRCGVRAREWVRSPAASDSPTTPPCGHGRGRGR